MLMTSKCRPESPSLKPGKPASPDQSVEDVVADGDDSSSVPDNSTDADDGNEWQDFPIEGRVRAIGEVHPVYIRTATNVYLACCC